MSFLESAKVIYEYSQLDKKMNSQPPPSPSRVPWIVSILFLVLIIIGLGIWIAILLLRRPPPCPEQSCPPVQTPIPVYLYGFTPGPSSREIASSSGVLTPSNGSLRLSPLNQAAPLNQQWRLISRGTGTLLQHVPTSRYLSISPEGGLTFTDDQAQALIWTIPGPFRNGRIYFIRSGDRHLVTNDDLSVSLLTVTTARPLNAEWIIALGTCQTTGTGPC